MKKKKKKITTKKAKKKSNVKVKKNNNTKRKTKKRNKKSEVLMIKSSQKNILTRANKLEKVKPIITNVSSSNKNTIKKTKSRKFSKRYSINKLKIENINKILSKNKSKNRVYIGKEEIIDNKGWAILSYICAPYVYLMKKDSPYVSLHTNRGMKIFYVEVIYLVLYYLTKDKIKTPTSCDNFAHYTFSQICTAAPWWVNFIWALLALAIVFTIVKFIKIVLTEKEITDELLN